jgi:hypothetical protein
MEMCVEMSLKCRCYSRIQSTEASQPANTLVLNDYEEGVGYID